MVRPIGADAPLGHLVVTPRTLASDMSRRISLGLLAIAGVLVGHALGYLVAYPDDAERAMAGAGHGYLGPVAAVVAPFGLAAVLAIAVRTVRRLAAAPSLWQLAGVQVLVFAAQEVLERIPGPGQPVDVITERAVWFGLVAQLLVAWLSLRLVGLTARVVRAVARAPRPRLVASPPRVACLRSARVPVHPALGRLPRRRGPPALLGAVSA